MHSEEKGLLISPCNTHRSCCAIPFGAVVASPYGLFLKIAHRGVYNEQVLITHHFF